MGSTLTEDIPPLLGRLALSTEHALRKGYTQGGEGVDAITTHPASKMSQTKLSEHRAVRSTGL